MSRTTEFPIERLREAQTPCYFYDMRLLDDTLAAVRAEVPASDPAYCVHYAIKANANPTILARIARQGFGADCVSGGEIKLAVEAGIPAKKVVYAGVGKTDAEIEYALQIGIGCFNVESEPELRIINEIAERMGKVARVALRVNPNIDAHTHHYITTGLAENKFGINLEHLPAIVASFDELKAVKFDGLHFHIGSQILSMEPYEVLCRRIAQIQDELENQGIRIHSINVGGGLGIDYDEPDRHPVPDFRAYFDTFRNNLKLKPWQTLHFELGRSLVAQCGSLITRVIYVKHGTAKQFAIVDAGMTELIRPALYGAFHLIQNLTNRGPRELYDVVGPVCESSDYFGKNVKLSQARRGDLFAIRSAGAYGEAMASNYNCRQLQPAVFSVID